MVALPLPGRFPGRRYGRLPAKAAGTPPAAPPDAIVLIKEDKIADAA